MMRRIRSLIGRDLRSSLRDYMLLYTLVAPILVALVLRAFIPTVGEATITMVVPEDMPVSIVEALRGYGTVEMRRDAAAVEARVLQIDDAVGIIPSGGTYVVLLEGNENAEIASIPALVLAEIVGPRQVEVVHQNLGQAGSPIRPLMSTMMVLMGMLIAGLFIGLNIVDDKESNIFPVLGTSPMSRMEYIAGRSVLALILSVVLGVAALLAIGTWPVNLAQVLVLAIGGTILAIILGLYIGSVASNQIEAIGVLKLASLPYMVIPLLVFFVAPRLHWTMYWLPTYWTAAGLKAMLLDGAALGEVWRIAGIGFGVSLAFLVLSWKGLSKRLALRG